MLEVIDSGMFEDLTELGCPTPQEMEENDKLIEEINRLKKEKNAIILAHYYMRDPIKLGIADFMGDSLELSRQARDTDADIIVFCGVKFMAETAKILSPDKKVLLPTLEAGCSLAESITGEQVRELRKLYPEAAFVCYVNTNADVKAECDVCVTSSNVEQVVSRLPQEHIVYLPDGLMGENLKPLMPDKRITTWHGTCIVHEQFDRRVIELYRKKFPGVKVLAHEECMPEVIEVADMRGSTSQMRKFIEENDAPAYVLLTECGLASTVQLDNPSKHIVGPCMQCPYMKKVTLKNTLEALQNESPEIDVPEDIRVKAKKALDRMFELTT